MLLATEPTIHFYPGWGFGVEPCASCGGKLLPGQERVVVSQEGRPRHVTCPSCMVCGEAGHEDGVCLL